MGTPLNPPNFSASNAQFASHANQAGNVERISPDTIGNYTNGEVKSIFMSQVQIAATAGSCSFAGGVGMSLGSLAADTMYEFPGITQISSSTAEVFVFKN